MFPFTGFHRYLSKWCWLPAGRMILTVFVFVNLSLIRIKQKDPKPEGIRRYPIWVPVLGLLFSLAVLVVEVVLAVVPAG